MADGLPPKIDVHQNKNRLKSGEYPAIDAVTLMKFKNIVPTQVERILADSELIISKTDTKGKITYGNRPFQDYSGFSENELLGVQHNIVRHPDMPRAVFKLLWDEVQAGREVFAFVKNLSKDGSFYWVFANVTPSFDMKNKIVGYFSVRRKPKRSALPQIAVLYQKNVARRAPSRFS